MSAPEPRKLTSAKRKPQTSPNREWWWGGDPFASPSQRRRWSFSRWMEPRELEAAPHSSFDALSLRNSWIWGRRQIIPILPIFSGSRSTPIAVRECRCHTCCSTTHALLRCFRIIMFACSHPRQKDTYVVRCPHRIEKKEGLNSLCVSQLDSQVEPAPCVVERTRSQARAGKFFPLCGWVGGCVRGCPDQMRSCLDADCFLWWEMKMWELGVGSFCRLLFGSIEFTLSSDDDFGS